MVVVAHGIVMLSDDINRIIADWEQLIMNYGGSVARVMANAPALDTSDVRLALYGLSGGALFSGLLTMKMINCTVLNNEWWDANVPQIDMFEHRQLITEEFLVHCKITAFTLFISFYESTIRVLLRAVLPRACNNAYDAFANVYICLLTHLDLKHHIPVLDFARTFRNLIHNNGVYVNSKGTDLVLPFNGKTYFFEHGKKVNFAYPELLFTITREILKISDDINAHPDVLNLPLTPMV